MNSGVEILIERAKTNPEEFAYRGKWVDMVKMYRQYMTDEERLALEAAIREGLMGEFTELVLKGLAGEPIKMHETMAHRCSENYAKQKEKEEKEEAALVELRITQSQMAMQAQYSGSGLGLGNQGMNGLLGGLAMNQANQASLANQSLMYQNVAQSDRYNNAFELYGDPVGDSEKKKPEPTTISKIKATMNKMRRGK